MKVLYAIQGTGNGHVSRARDVIPALQKHCDLDLLISGRQSEVKLAQPIKYNYKGFSFIYNRKGGLSYTRSGWSNLSPQLMREILSLPVKQYDLIINDFEPVSAWASRLRGVPCVAMGHQAAFLSPHTPRPAKQDPLGEMVLKNYAPASEAIGFHFDRYDDFIFPPVIREDIRQQEPTNRGHYTVYLPAFRDDVLIGVLRQIPGVEWQVFSKYAKQPARVGNVFIRPVDNEAFLTSFVHCRGMLTGAGFEAPAEALYMGKKLFCIPIRGQYEQYCNAAALEKMGVTVAWRVDRHFIGKISDWVNEEGRIQVDFPDELDGIIANLFGREREEVPV
jgi:uncharacterized protein (TIGR00661 family)